MNLAKISEVIKTSPAIQIQSKISLLQRRAWNVLLANAYNELQTAEVHRVSVVELAAKLGYDSNDLEYLKETLEALGACQVKWNLLNKDDKERWGFANLLASAEIENGICTYAFAPHLRWQLYNPRIYAKLNLRLQNRFKSQYALVLWEVCFDYFDTDRGQGETPFIPLETFRELMGIEASEYQTFKALNQFVIKPAVKEINDLTDYHVEIEQKRIGRRIGELKFRITKVKQLPVQESLFPDIENLSPVAIGLIQSEVDRNIALKVADVEWEFVTTDKLPTPGTYRDFQAYVSEKIEMSLLASDVRNRGGFIVEAIRENYQDPALQKARVEREAEARKKEIEDLTEEFRAKRRNIIRQVVLTAPELIERAAEKVQSNYVLQRIEEGDSLIEVYETGGMVKAEIDAILADHFCQDLIAPIVEMYEVEKARILGGNWLAKNKS